MNQNTSTQISVTLTPEFGLAQALKQAGVENPATITKLTIAGTVTNNVFAYIKKNRPYPTKCVS